MATTADTLSLIDRLWRALLRSDVAALLVDYTEDAVFISGTTGVVESREAIGRLLTTFVSSIIPAATTHFSMDLIHASGDLGYIV